MIDYEKVGLEFLDTAPVRFELRATLNKTPAALFELFEGTDSWGWAGIVGVTWHGEPPFDSTISRTIEVKRQARVLEQFLLWEQDRRMAFRFEKGDIPVFAAFAEDYQVEAMGPTKSQLVWRIGMQLRGPWALLAPILRGVLRRRFQAMLDDLVAQADRQA